MDPDDNEPLRRVAPWQGGLGGPGRGGDRPSDDDDDERLGRAAPQQGDPGVPGGGPPVPNVVELQRGMTIVSQELSKCVNYPVIELQAAMTRMERTLDRMVTRGETRDRQITLQLTRIETRQKNLTARFYNQAAVRLVDVLMPLYSLILDLTQGLEINSPIPNFPSTVLELRVTESKICRYILNALDWPHHGLDDVGLQLALRKAIGVGFGFEG